MEKRELRIELLGGLRASGPSGQMRASLQQTGCLLALLALHLERGLTREELIAALWPEDDPDTARQRLRQRLFVLKKQLEQLVPVGLSVLYADKSHVALDPVHVGTDLAEFNTLIGSASSAASPTDQLGLLEKALALVKGSLLPGLYGDVFVTHQDRFSAQHRQLLEDLCAVCERLNDPQRALGFAQQLEAIDPYDEEAAARSIRLLRSTGRPFSARATLEKFNTRLEEALGLPASDRLQLALEEELPESIPTRRIVETSADPAVADVDGLPTKVQPTGLRVLTGRARAMAYVALPSAGVTLWLIGQMGSAAQAGPSTKGVEPSREVIAPREEVDLPAKGDSPVAKPKAVLPVVPRPKKSVPEENHGESRVEPVAYSRHIADFSDGFASLQPFHVSFRQDLDAGYTGPSVQGGALRLTDGYRGLSTSVWLKQRVPLRGMSCKFTFRVSSPPGNPGDLADGMAIVIQNESESALGTGGSNLGYQGIRKSACLKIDLWGGNEGRDSCSKGWGFYTNGASPLGGDPIPFEISEGRIYAVEFSYDGQSLLTARITDTATKKSATRQCSIDLAKLLGSPDNRAWVGFTGGTGNGWALQEILSLQVSVPTLGETARDQSGRQMSQSPAGR